MRFELAGRMSGGGVPSNPGSPSNPVPLVISFTANATFSPKTYLDLGYTDFEVICIGGGGGPGGGYKVSDASHVWNYWGGSGGGGGCHRVRGLLSVLPGACPIVVGAGGAPGYFGSAFGSITDGQDGGVSTFNTNTCQASGGKGGSRVTGYDPGGYGVTGGGGGAGGKGGTAVAGGGGAGGATGGSIAGADGAWDGSIGTGGGGGQGGYYNYGLASPGYQVSAIAGKGGAGSWNSGDQSVYSPGYNPVQDVGVPPGGIASSTIVPGIAGGAKATPLNGLPDIYGGSGPADVFQTGGVGARFSGMPGVVVVRLTTA
jgi:hypothetical protein